MNNPGSACTRFGTCSVLVGYFVAVVAIGFTCGPGQQDSVDG